MPYLLHQLLSESAARHSEAPALLFNGQSITYAELERESNRFANFLATVGVRKGARVGIYMHRTPESVEVLFGILKSGSAYVPIDPTSPPARLAYILAKCGITCVVITRDKAPSLSRASADCPTLTDIVVVDGLPNASVAGARMHDWPAIRESVSAVMPRADGADVDLAYILFTSGSTGSPKGVMISHLNALTFVTVAHDVFEIRCGDRLSNVCPLHFDMSVFDLFVATKAGAAMVIIPETTTMFPVRLADTIMRSRISVWNSVPSVLSLLATYKNLTSHDMSSLRLVLFAGEVMSMKHLRRLQTAMPRARFCNMYGQTEANSSMYFWIDSAAPDTMDALPLGAALPNFDVFALDDTGTRVAGPAIEGELYVRSSTVAMGYWGEPEATQRAFIQHPLNPESNERVYRTGDMVRLDGSGNYIFAGRKDQMIKSRGYRIETNEIESVLSLHPNIQQAVIVPIPDEVLGNRILAIVVPAVPNRITQQDVTSHCLTRLPKYMVPEIVEFRDSLPTTASGKVDRKRLFDEYAGPA